MLRRTKIIATLGPATSSPERIRRIIQLGTNLVRINMSHGTTDAHEKQIELVRSCARDLHTVLGIVVDLQGPKIRIAQFQKGSVLLEPGASFVLDTALDKSAGTVDIVGVDYPALSQEVHSGDTLLLDDGLIVLEVKQCVDTQVRCVVKAGGILSNHKGINRQGGGLTAQALTSKDREDILFAAKVKADYVAISFPRSAKDIEETRALLQQAGSPAAVIAKIERVEAVLALEEIIKSADAVLVARGDLGVEVGYAEVPAIQKQIIARARALDRAVITATQMMESMVHSPLPTRAEVSDVANAVLDGTDAVMLSAETAVGDFPEQVVAAMDSVCLAAERQKITQVSHHRLECQFEHVDEAIAMATMYTANHLKVRAIIAFTETGSIPLWMSRIRSGIPIYGLSRHALVQGRMTLYRGVYPVHFDTTACSPDQILPQAIQILVKLEAVETGDRLVIANSEGSQQGENTNTMKIITV